MKHGLELSSVSYHTHPNTHEFNFVCGPRIALHFRTIFHCIFGNLLLTEFYWHSFSLVPKPGDTSVASNRVCNLEKLVGTGGDPAKFSPRWYFDSKGSYMCESFLYSGSGGNENNFKTKALCIQKCSHAGNVFLCLNFSFGIIASLRVRWLDISQGFSYMFMDNEELGQYPPILTEQDWSIKDLLYGYRNFFLAGHRG